MKRAPVDISVDQKTMQNLIDSHCHFDFPEFDSDRAALWKQCAEMGVTSLIVPAVAPSSWQRVRKISEDHLGVYYALGLHPWWVEKESENLQIQRLTQDIAGNLDETNCVAIGECGLDKTMVLPVAVQQLWFEAQLQLATELSKPIIIHCVKAHNEMIRLLKAYRPSAGGVIHGFSGNVEIAQTYWELGFYMGIGGTITYPRACKTRNSVTQMPLQAILLETDAPDMPLHGHQGKRNSPTMLPQVAQTLAELRGQPLEQITRQTSDNVTELFNL